MKKFKMIIAAVAIAAFGTNASAQYWGESEVTNYVFAGYTSAKITDVTMPGFQIGLGDINQINMGNWFWDYNIELGYNFKKDNGVKYNALSFKYGMDIMYKFDASENAFIFPFVGVGCRPFITGNAKVDGLGSYNWFKKTDIWDAGKRFQTALQFGVHAFIGSVMVRAEYQYYLTKMWSNADKIKAFAISIGYRF